MKGYISKLHLAQEYVKSTNPEATPKEFKNEVRYVFAHLLVGWDISIVRDGKTDKLSLVKR